MKKNYVIKEYAGYVLYAFTVTTAEGYEDYYLTDDYNVVVEHCRTNEKHNDDGVLIYSQVTLPRDILQLNVDDLDWLVLSEDGLMRKVMINYGDVADYYIELLSNWVSAYGVDADFCDDEQNMPF